jgi:hypothetical protein
MTLAIRGQVHGLYVFSAGHTAQERARYASKGALGLSPGFQPWALSTNRRNGRYLEIIAYGANEYRLEAYTTLPRCASRRSGGDAWVIARRSGEQCSIGFQPVSFALSSDAFPPARDLCPKAPSGHSMTGAKYIPRPLVTCVLVDLRSASSTARVPGLRSDKPADRL